MKKILLVDDDAAHRMMLRAILDDKATLSAKPTTARWLLRQLRIGCHSRRPTGVRHQKNRRFGLIGSDSISNISV